MLTRDSILSTDDLPLETVEVPEWKGSVQVRAMTAAERDAFEQSVIEGGQRNFDNIRARLAVLTVVDADGKRLFNDDDVETLGRKSASALDRIFTVAQRLNGLRNADVEELAKNSEAGPSAGLPTA